MGKKYNYNIWFGNEELHDATKGSEESVEKTKGAEESANLPAMPPLEGDKKS